jgi:hypothetical protein
LESTWAGDTLPRLKPTSARSKLAVALFLGAIVWCVFGQTAGSEFVNFDDDIYVLNDKAVTGGVTSGSLKAAFDYTHSDNWVPLTTVSHMLDCQLYGLNARGHHVSNVLLHSAAVMVLFLFLAEAGIALWPAAVVAAVFAIHPLRAESVAWVTERKDVLSGVFFMGTLWAYGRYVKSVRCQRVRNSKF